MIIFICTNQEQRRENIVFYTKLHESKENLNTFSWKRMDVECNSSFSLLQKESHTDYFINYSLRIPMKTLIYNDNRRKTITATPFVFCLFFSPTFDTFLCFFFFDNGRYSENLFMIVVNQPAGSEAEMFRFRFYVRFQEAMFKADFEQHAARDEDLFDKTQKNS